MVGHLGNAYLRGVGRSVQYSRFLRPAEISSALMA